MTAVPVTLVILSMVVVSITGCIRNKEDATHANNRIETISNLQAVVDRIWIESTKTDTVVVFTDIDETLVMKEGVVFDYAASERMLKSIEATCDADNMEKIWKEMEQRYYDLPLTLLDQEAPAQITSLHQDPVIDVFALTSRDYPDNNNTESLIKGLINFGFQFTHIPGNFDFSYFENSQGLLLKTEQESMLGGVIFANGEKVNKGYIMKDFLNSLHYLVSADLADLPVHVVFLDNSLSKVQAATEAFHDDGIVFTGIHYTREEDFAATWEDMLNELDDMKQSLAIPASTCTVH